MAPLPILSNAKEHLEQNYTVKEEFRGAGTYGTVSVYTTKNPNLPQQVAVKTVRDSKLARREIDSLKKAVNEPNIVKLLGYNEFPFYIVMECCNVDLAALAEKRNFDLNQDDLLKVCLDTLKGLGSLEKLQIVHRDIKPRNLFIDYCGSDGSCIQLCVVKVGDLGECRAVNKEKLDKGEHNELTKDRGTPGYVAPELAALLDWADCKYSFKVDVWSLGASLIYLAGKGQKPLTEEFLRKLLKEVNTCKRRDKEILDKIREYIREEECPAIVSIVEHMLKWDESERYSAHECIGLVKHFQTQELTRSQKKSSSVMTKTAIPQQDANMFIKGLDSYTDAVERGETTFKVKVKDPNAPVVFYINGKRVSKCDTRCKYVNVGEGKHQLILHNIKMEDMGTIEARTPSNRGDEMLTSSTKFEVAMGEHAPEVGDCGPVTGIPNKECCWKLPYKCEGVQQSPLVVTVMFRGKELKIGLDVNVIIHQGNIELSVINPKREKSGIYTVTMKNAQGESSRDINVNIMGEKQLLTDTTTTEQGEGLKNDIFEEKNDNKKCGVIKRGKIIYYQNERLGGGASSTVYRGRYENKVAAVKIINKNRLKDIEENREKTILRLLNHKNIVECFGEEEDDDSFYLALSLCRTDFARAIEHPMLSKLDVITLLEEATKGMEFIHSKTETKDVVTHRDVKPSNLFIYEDQQTGQQKVMIGDFGLSKKSEPDASYVSIQSGCGTRGWKAPEMMRLEQRNVAFRKVSVLSDIFPLGCVFYYMLTNGRHPFQKGAQPEMFRELNIYNGDYSLEDLDEEQFPHSRALIQKMISHNPKDRPSATEILSNPMFTTQERPRFLSPLLKPLMKWFCPTPNCSSIEGHSCRFIQSYHSNQDVTFFRSVKTIYGKDWFKKIRNRLANGTITHDEIVVVLSGTHGPKTALTEKDKAEPSFVHEDQNFIKVLKNEFPSHREIELVDVSAFHQKHEDLKKMVFSLNPKYIILAFCNSNHCTCDIKKLFFQ